MKIFLIFLLSLLVGIAKAQQIEPDWTEGHTVPEFSRNNPYNLSPEEKQVAVKKGLIHALVYPVKETGLLLPERPFKNLFDNQEENPFRKILNNVFRNLVQIKSYEELFTWVGLHKYPNDGSVPFPEGKKPDYLMGYSRFEVNGVKVFTLSCASCHSGNLFGDKVMGMTNRFPRANHFFIRGQKMGKMYNPHWYRAIAGATKAETEITNKSVESLRSIGFKMPLQLGLDTSLAQVALSLNKREKTPWAEQSDYYEKHPRVDMLDQTPGDSKPAVWWNVKYKNRWLSDGSVVSGNPIYTNILWNEIGRGTDLRVLDNWLTENSATVKEMTAAVFATEAPRIEKYFPESMIDPIRARKGEVLFNQSCARCHGTYTKAWSLPDADTQPWRDRMQTVLVTYPRKTRVVDVGTDSNRYAMMKSLEKLNDLAVSQKLGVKITAQKGYVPPPLVGIWARWPYFHNNSAPTLCEVLTPYVRRAKIYYAGEALDKKRDFDFECNGYPSGNRVPAAWKTAQMKFDTTREAMSNRGHDEKIFIQDGKEIFSSDDKKNLIQFLQTL